MKKLLLTITIITAATGLISGCEKHSEGQSAKRKKAAAVKVATAREDSISKTLELTGSVTATKVARMGSPAEGPVMKCQVREGDRVDKGEALLTIGRSKAADARVKAAREQLSREQEELKRVKKLVDSGAIPAEELEMANLRVSRAKADLSEAMESLEDYQIRAPLDGVISKILVTDGYYAAPRESLVEIYDPDSTVIEFAVPESQAAKVHKGMQVEVELQAYSGQRLKGEITRIYPELNRQTRTRTTEAELIYNDDITLLPGMFARILIEMETVDNAVLIPDKAIVLNNENEPTAFVIANGKAEARKLTLGLEKDLIVQVVEGIKPGETVVVDGNEKLKNGTAVKVIGGKAEKEIADSGNKQ